jgi:hypothetical protein
VKEEVYRTKPTTLNRIRHVLTNVPQEFLQKSVENIPWLLQALVQNAGAYVEF